VAVIELCLHNRVAGMCEVCKCRRAVEHNGRVDEEALLFAGPTASLAYVQTLEATLALYCLDELENGL